MQKIIQFSDLHAWQESHKLVLLVYEVTKSFPAEEKFSLTSQIRRAAVSITSNIAEGFGRQGVNDKLHFYVMSRGSLLELQNQLIIAADIKILGENEHKQLELQLVKAHKILNGLLRSIRQDD